MLTIILHGFALAYLICSLYFGSLIYVTVLGYHRRRNASFCSFGTFAALYNKGRFLFGTPCKRKVRPAPLELEYLDAFLTQIRAFLFMG